MTCVVIPFPPLRLRRDLIERHARIMTQRTPDAAERHLLRQLQIKGDVMSRQGVDPDLIETELRGMEGAIRGELWRLVLTPGGAA